MIKVDHTEVVGWKAAIRGMRNPMNSWEQSDSLFIREDFCDDIEDWKLARMCGGFAPIVKDNDFSLMQKLCKAGSDHRKFMRMLVVYCDITAPLYWWKEYDTYKVGTVANSCSTMHKIHSKSIELSDFSINDFNIDDDYNEISLEDMFINVVADCELLRMKYLETKDKRYWKGLIQLLPTSYNQKRTVMLNYEVLTNIYHARRNHKLDEWHDFCKWIESLPYSELITGKDGTDGKDDPM